MVQCIEGPTKYLQYACKPLPQAKPCKDQWFLSLYGTYLATEVHVVMKLTLSIDNYICEGYRKNSLLRINKANKKY